MQKQTNDIYIYEKGKLINVIHKPGSSHPILHYVYWLFAYWSVLITQCRREDKWVLLAGHPIFFFFMSLQKRIRNIKFAYWVGDYFPDNGWKIRLYEKLKKHYHDAIPIAYYLSDRINICMNKGIINHSVNRQTVAWGMKPSSIKRKTMNSHSLAFVGVMKPSQNIEAILEYLHKNLSWKVKLIGICEGNYYEKLKKLIKRYSIEKRVWFPNEFIPERQLKKELENCLIGLALYRTDKTQFTWYTDPGKIKTYLEFGLPVIMTDTSLITKDIVNFHCGEIMKKRTLDDYINKVIKNYSVYQKGVQNLILNYEYLKYYDDHFVALRK
jgi:glycosyltransferase involved in cell wall biosynthesis